MRRVIYNMRLLGAPEPTMGELVGATVEAMAPQYPELNDEVGRITSVAVSEESAFRATLRTGTTLFDNAVVELQQGGSSVLSGERAFALHDTHGFPIDLTLELAADQGLSVDEEGFRRLMAEQRERAKADSQSRKSGFAATTAYREILESGGSTTFRGYDEILTEATILGIVVDSEAVPVAKVGQHAEVIVDRTPFYAEAGGQLGDHGTISTAEGALFEVYDVQSPVPGLFVHRGQVVDGEVVQGSTATARVDIERRKAISRAHTATHMIHRAFREQLGETATQMGSENAPGRLRFDFPSPEPVAGSVLRDVESRVNEILIEDLDVHAQVMSQEEARTMGAMALFGEKYADEVRVVSVGDWAHELCGGTHARRSGQLGVVSFLSEGSIGAGIRRVEALVGVDAYRHLAGEHLLVQRLSELVKVPRDQVLDRVERTIGALKDAERELLRFKTADLLAGVDEMIGEGREVGGVRLFTFRTPEGLGGKELRDIAMHAKGRVGKDQPAVFVGTATTQESTAVIVVCTPAAVASGVRAKDVMAVAGERLGSRGGGKDDVAQGGGGNPDSIDAAFEDVYAFVRDRQ
jgi:alanyl-tRNA synthetase